MQHKFYFFDPNDGYYFFKSYDEAVKAANDRIDEYADECRETGEWAPDMTEMECGELTPRARVVEYDLRPVILYDDEGEEYQSDEDFTCNYSLEDV